MGYDLRGVHIYSLGEWVTLTRSFGDQSVAAPPTVNAWIAGEDVDPFDLYLALNFARLEGDPTEETHKLLDLGLERLRLGFPEQLNGVDEGT